MKHRDMAPHGSLRRTPILLLAIALLLLTGPVEIVAQVSSHVSNEMLATSQPSFIRNDGQWNPRAKFLLRSPGLDLWITATGVVYDVNRIERIEKKPDRTGARVSSMDEEQMPEMARSPELRVRRDPVFITFEGARADASALGDNRLEEYHNYFIGNDPSRWTERVPLFGNVRVQGLYDGIDALFYLEEGRPRYDLMVAPGADPSRIGMRIEGARKVSVGSNGALEIATALGTIEQRGLFAYQMIDGKRERVPCAFVAGSGGRVRFDLGDYDRTRPLVIDPLVYSTYLGGSDADDANGMAIDGDGNAYVCGLTFSTDFPLFGASQGTNAGGVDAFVTKLTHWGARAYSTYLGGSGSLDQATGIAVNDSGHVYISGSTGSTDFPTRNALQAASGGGSDGFVTKLTSSGALSWSTYLGGSSSDHGSAITIDDLGNPSIAGRTSSTNFPTRNALIPTAPASSNGFITRLTSSGTLVWSTYFGGSDADRCNGIAVDGSRNVYVTGTTYSTNFPLSLAAQGTFGGDCDLFVAKLTSGGALSWSTYIGGNDVDMGTAVAVDRDGNAFVTGHSSSENYPRLNASQTSLVGNTDVILTKLTTAGAFSFSTYLGGGTDNDYGNGIDIDRTGRIHIVGMTRSANFAAINPIQPTYGGGTEDAFVMKLANGGAVIYSTFLGGSDQDHSTAIAVDDRGSAYVAGSTESTNFPVLKASQTTNGGQLDAFVTRLSDRPIVDMIAPAPGATWCTGEVKAIRWISAGVSTVNIDISSNGGTNWTRVASSVAAPGGTYSWEIPSNRPAGTNYRIRVSDVDNATTADTTAASFTINTLSFPTITSPATPVVTAFSSITITSTGTGTPAPTIQWEKSMDDIDYSPISGATSSTLTLASVTMTDPWRYYRAVYTNPCRSYRSDPVFLTVIKATAQILLVNLGHVYDGSPRSAIAITVPAGLAVDITYSRDGSPVAAPTDAGRYEVTATIRDTNYTGTITDTLVIEESTAVPGDGDKVATGITARVVPNPLGRHGGIHLQGLAPGRVQATIHDISGRPLKKIEANATGAETMLPIDIGELPSGFYTVRITTARGAVTVGMQVVR